MIEAFLYSRKADTMPANTMVVFGIGILFWAVLSSVIYTSPYRAYKMPSRSMSPTMDIGDHFVVNRSEHSKTNAKRRAIITFHDPQGTAKIFVKRIVAVSGDTVEIRNDSLFVNNAYVYESPEYYKQTPVAPDEM
jgi:signal peptidase I